MTSMNRDVYVEHSETPGPSERASRVVTDEDGKLWRVREVRFADAPPSLIFESDLGFRRVRAYPRNWFSLTEKELLALSWRT
jgi:hypothetical protein